MFHSLSNVQRDDAIHLRQCIDNSCGKLRVGLRSITYTVGWYNIESGERVISREVGNDDRNTVSIPPGLYGFKRFKDIMESVGDFGTLEVNKENGLVNLTVANGQLVYLTDGLLSLLGLDDRLGGRWLNEGVYIGDRPINFSAKKLLYVYLDQINTSNNIIDGTSSNLLSCIGLNCHSYGDINTIHFEHPEYKLLQNSTINEWKITIKDENDNVLDNHDLPIYISLEIK